MRDAHFFWLYGQDNVGLLAENGKGWPDSEDTLSVFFLYNYRIGMAQTTVSR